MLISPFTVQKSASGIVYLSGRLFISAHDHLFGRKITFLSSPSRLPPPWTPQRKKGQPSGPALFFVYLYARYSAVRPPGIRQAKWSVCSHFSASSLIGSPSSSR